MTQNTELPGGSWTHSFEEDEAGVEVYRPTATFAFPPSRKGGEVLRFATQDDERASPRCCPAPTTARAPRRQPPCVRWARDATRWAMTKELKIIEATPAILKLVRR